jgi:hypothetical protein
VFAGVVILGLVGAVILGVASEAPVNLPGIALGSTALLLAERMVALFAIWMAIAVVVIRAFRNQIPVEISGRGVRYAEAEDVEAKSTSTEGILHDVDAEIRWLRDAVLELQNAAPDNLRKGNQGDW